MKGFCHKLNRPLNIIEEKIYFEMGFKAETLKRTEISSFVFVR